MLITAQPLVEVVPLEHATKPGVVVAQWNKDSVEDAGLIKIDLLSLRTLGMVSEVCALIAQRHGVAPDLDALPLDDPAIYRLLAEGDTIGCFQVESRAQSSDAAAAQAAVLRRPHHRGLHRPARPDPGRHGASLPAPAPGPGAGDLPAPQPGAGPERDAGRDHLPGAGDPGRGGAGRLHAGRGRPAAPGDEPQPLGRGDGRLARRASWPARRPTASSAAVAEEVFGQLQGFATYGFCKSHAAAFALIAYQTLWLKAHYPAEFYCALLNHQPMGFYSPEVVVGDAKRHGITVLRPDVNASEDGCTLEDGSSGEWEKGRAERREPRSPTHPFSRSPALRLGLRYLSGLGEAGRARLLAARAAGPFADLADFCRRTRLPRPLIGDLIRAGALDGFGVPKRQLLWTLGGLHYAEDALVEAPDTPADLPDLTEREAMTWDYELLGLSPDDHPLRLWRARLRGQGVLSAAELAAQPAGKLVQVAGMVVVRQAPPTAKGHLFITLEDETGLVNLIIRPDLYERERAALHRATLLMVEGRLQREGAAISVLVQAIRSNGSLTANAGSAPNPRQRLAYSRELPLTRPSAPGTRRGHSLLGTAAALAGSAGHTCTHRRCCRCGAIKRRARLAGLLRRPAAIPSGPPGSPPICQMVVQWNTPAQQIAAHESPRTTHCMTAPAMPSAWMRSSTISSSRHRRPA